MPTLSNHLLILVFISILWGCQKDDPITPTPSNQFSDQLQVGTWRISSYLDNGQDETSSFSGYAFQFGSGNVLTATKNNMPINGTWNVVKDDSGIKLLLVFSAPPDFESLSDDWKVGQYSATQIQLTDTSGGNGRVDYLRFERN